MGVESEGIYFIRPAPYPNRDVPAHIHIIVKEPGKYLTIIDDAEKRGGDLIIHLAKNNENVWTGDLRITLDINIPDYK